MGGNGLAALANLPFAAGIGSALIAVHLLLSGAGPKSWPNRFLGMYFSLFACQLFVLSYQLDSPETPTGLYRAALILAANPLVFLFFKSLCSGGDFVWRYSYALHFLPCLLVPALLAADSGDGLDLLLFLSMAGYGTVYLLALRAGPGQFPAAASKAYLWLKAFAVFYAFSAILDASIALELLRGGALEDSYLLPVAVLVLFAASLVLFFGAMGKRPLFDWLLEMAAAKGRQDIPDDVLAELATRIQSMIANKKIYGDENITLTRFARRMGVPSRQVSQAINRRLQMSFSDLLNRVRVDAATNLLSDAAWSERSIVDIAFEVGFRSKSNFHRAFKLHTGMTPGEFRAGPGTAE